MTAAESGAEPTGESAELIVYARPGCPFCSSLRSGLRRRAVEFREIDIWQDPDAAAVVRGIADGSETVPTVVLGPWQAVNPSVDEVLDAARRHAPHLVPEAKPGPISGALNALGLRKS